MLVNDGGKSTLDLGKDLLSLVHRSTRGDCMGAASFNGLTSTGNRIIAIVGVSFVPGSVAVRVHVKVPTSLGLRSVGCLISTAFRGNGVMISIRALVRGGSLVTVCRGRSTTSSYVGKTYLRCFPTGALI